MNYSVLMSVYHKENPEYLRAAIDSMLCQTVKPAQVVLVCDGPLTPELDEVIKGFGNKLDVLRLDENMGLGKALEEGLKRCSCELVARMDTDDLSLPDRCEKQLAAFEKDESLALLSGAVEEFSDDPETPFAKRVVPLEHSDILSYSKKRNPFNHPAVMFKKQAVLDAGGYNSDYYLFEDYDLWVRVLQSGARTANLPDTLVKMRSSGGQVKRRGGFKFAQLMLKFRKHLKQCGWISRSEYVTSAYPHAAVCVVPSFMRRGVYKILRRKDSNI